MPATLKLKVYCIGNLDGSNMGAVAAPTKAAAAEALNVRGQSKAAIREAIPDGEIEAERDVYGLALATPGTVWTRKLHYGPRPYPRWRCRDELAGAKAIVRARFPEASATRSGPASEWRLWVNAELDDSIVCAPTESAAWLDAARVLSIESPEGLPGRTICIWSAFDAPYQFRELDPTAEWIAWVPDGVATETFDRWVSAGAKTGRYPIRGGEVRVGIH